MSVPTCDHLKEDGVYCDSPALHGQNFCYFHLNARARRLQASRLRTPKYPPNSQRLNNLPATTCGMRNLRTKSCVTC